MTLWRTTGSWTLAAALLLASAAAAPARAPKGARTKPPVTKTAESQTPVSDADVPVPGGNAGAKPPAAGEQTDQEVLKGGQDGTVFRSLTVQGDDRIHLDVERPALTLELDPEKAPGLDLGDAADVLGRSVPDGLTPFTALSARAPSPYVAQPWLQRFSTGALARFRPEVENVERWRLLVADSRGGEVARFEGKGNPPREIAWDGRGKDGSLIAAPGRTYSHVFEAWDKAGNRRHFVGRGFSMTTYRRDTPAGPVLLFTGRELDRSGATHGSPGALLVEAATWIHQAPDPYQPVRVTAIARRSDHAAALAERVRHGLAPLLVGDPARVRPVVEVQADAPEDGVVRIELAK